MYNAFLLKSIIRDFDKVYARFKKVLQCFDAYEISNALETGVSIVREAERQKIIPQEWYLRIFDKYGVNPDWLMNGCGPIYIKKKDGNFIIQDKNVCVIYPDIDSDIYTLNLQVPVFSESICKNNRSKLNIIREITIPMFLYTSNLCVFYHKYLEISGKEKFSYIGINTKDKLAIHNEKYIMLLDEMSFTLKTLDLETKKNAYLLKNDVDSSTLLSLSPEEFFEKVFGHVLWTLNIS